MIRRKDKNPTYYFIDVDLKSRQIIGWGSEQKDTVEVQLTSGYHRVFLTKGAIQQAGKGAGGVLIEQPWRGPCARNQRGKEHG
jgi:hypothetical protein